MEHAAFKGGGSRLLSIAVYISNNGITARVDGGDIDSTGYSSFNFDIIEINLEIKSEFLFMFLSYKWLYVRISARIRSV